MTIYMNYIAEKHLENFLPFEVLMELSDSYNLSSSDKQKWHLDTSTSMVK